jgi:dipeptidyl aminopeptidase/acylaminoacyl peptidase
MLEQNSPYLHAHKINTPTLIIAGERDSIVPLQQSKKMLKALRKHDKNVKFIRVKDAGHSVFRKTEDAKMVYSEITSFLNKHLNTNTSDLVTNN